MTTFLVWLGISTGIFVLIILLAWLCGLLGAFKINESTGTAFEFLGNYSCSIMSLKDFHFGPGEFIETGSGSDSTGRCWFLWRFGGLVVYLRGFVEPTNYTNRNNEDGFGKGVSVFLNQIQRDIKLDKAETKKGEEIPLNIKMAFKMKVVNIYLFLYRSPKDVIAKIVEIMEAIARGWVKSKEYDEIQAIKTNGTKIWDQFEADIKETIRKIKEDAGVEILEDSIFLLDVGLLQEDQVAYAAKKRQQLKIAAGAQEVLGAMLEIKALSMGIKDEEPSKDPAKKGQRRKTAVEQVVEKLQEPTNNQGQIELKAMVDKANEVVAQKVLGVRPVLVGNADGSKLGSVEGFLLSLLSAYKGGNESTPTPTSTDNPGDTSTATTGNKGGKPKSDEQKFLDKDF